MGDVTVTFLARRIEGHVLRVGSDVTGWGERFDGTFVVTAGKINTASSMHPSS
jgi:hypothetical protein